MFLLSQEYDTTEGNCYGGRNDYSHQNAIAVKRKKSGKMFLCIYDKPMLLTL